MTKHKNAAGPLYQAAYKKSTYTNYTKKTHKFTQNFSSNRNVLPDPADFYLSFFGSFRKSDNSDWAVTRCCFHHPDKNPSMSINLRTGAFHCWACGAKGHNIVDFYQLFYCVDRQTALEALRAWR